MVVRSIECRLFAVVGCMHAVHQHCCAFCRRCQLPCSPTARVHPSWPRHLPRGILGSSDRCWIDVGYAPIVSWMFTIACGVWVGVIFSVGVVCGKRHVFVLNFIEWNCTVLTRLLFWRAPLRVRSAKRRQQSLQSGRLSAISIASFRERFFDFRPCCKS